MKIPENPKKIRKFLGIPRDLCGGPMWRPMWKLDNMFSRGVWTLSFGNREKTGITYSFVSIGPTLSCPKIHEFNALFKYLCLCNTSVLQQFRDIYNQVVHSNMHTSQEIN